MTELSASQMAKINEITGGQENLGELYKVDIGPHSRFGYDPDGSNRRIIGEAEASGLKGSLSGSSAGRGDKLRRSPVVFYVGEEKDRGVLTNSGVFAERFVWVETEDKQGFYLVIPPLEKRVFEIIKEKDPKATVPLTEVALANKLKTLDKSARNFTLEFKDPRRKFILEGIKARQLAYLQAAREGKLSQQEGKERPGALVEKIKKLVDSAADSRSFVGLDRTSSIDELNGAYDDIAAGLLKIKMQLSEQPGVKEYGISETRERLVRGFLAATSQLRNEGRDNQLPYKVAGNGREDTLLLIQSLVLSDPYKLFGVLPFSSTRPLLDQISEIHEYLKPIIDLPSTVGQGELAKYLWSYFAETGKVIQEADGILSVEDRTRIRNLKNPMQQIMAIRKILKPVEDRIGNIDPPTPQKSA